MKIAKISLATVLALGLFGSASFAAEAQTLEEAIKGVSFDGLLRYRLNSDSYDNKGGKVGDNDTTTKHQYRAFGNFQTESVKNVSVNLGVLYINEDATTGTGSTGTGLGSGSDGRFGVASFYATIAPKDYTTTSIMIGKQILNTPLTGSDYDRATGILAVNKDIAGLTLVGAAFDTWSLNDMYKGDDTTSVSKGLFGVAAVYQVPEMLTAQLWFFNVKDIADSVLFADLAYAQKFGGFGARASLSYGYASLNTDDTSLLAGQESDNDLLKINVGADFGPAVVDVGYLMNTRPGYTVAFDDAPNGIMNSTTMGQTWWQDTGVRSSIGLGKRIAGGTSTPVNNGEEDSLNVLYGSVGAKNIANTGVGVHLTYVKGKAEHQVGSTTQRKRDFQEIVPLLNYKYSEKLSFQTFYSMLSADLTEAGGEKVTEKRNRYRLQALYKF